LTTVTSSQRKREDWEELADQLLPELQANGGMTAELRKQHGIRSVYRLQIALGRKGFDLHGRPLEVKPINAKRPDVVAKQIAGRRSKGEPFWLLEVESGLNRQQMERLLQEYGLTSTKNTTAAAATNGDA
jgi:hypothetical protein